MVLAAAVGGLSVSSVWHLKVAGGVVAQRIAKPILVQNHFMISCFRCAAGPTASDPEGNETVKKPGVTAGKTLEVVVSAGSQVRAFIITASIIIRAPCMMERIGKKSHLVTPHPSTCSSSNWTQPKLTRQT